MATLGPRATSPAPLLGAQTIRQAACVASSPLCEPVLLQYPLGGGTDLGGAIDDGRARGSESVFLRLRGAGVAGDDRPRVPHAPARRGGAAGDEGDDRLFHRGANVLGGVLLRITADLADQDHGFGL